MKTLKQHTILAAGFLVASLTGFAADSALSPEFVDTLVQPYLKIQSALAGDDLSGARNGAGKFLAALENGPEAGSLEGLRGTAGSLAKAEDITAARAAFLGLSNGLISIVQETGTTGDSSLYIAHCPMAFGGKGGDWMQTDKTVSNPYYGASMLRCGGIKEDLSKGGQHSHGTHQPDKEHMHHGHGMKGSSGHPHTGLDMDAIHAGVPGYTAQAGSSGGNKASAEGCQMACCQSRN